MLGSPMAELNMKGVIFGLFLPRLERVNLEKAAETEVVLWVSITYDKNKEIQKMAVKWRDKHQFYPNNFRSSDTGGPAQTAIHWTEREQGQVEQFRSISLIN